MPPRSLFEMSKAIAIKNVHAIDDIGDIPYDMVRPILMKIENPKQLRALERKCPQIYGVDGEIWRELIKRDVPDWESKAHELNNPKDWYTVYKKLVRENEARIAADTEVLRRSLAGIKSEQAKHKSKLVENPRFLPRVPVDPKLRQGANLLRKRSMPQRQCQPANTSPTAKKTKSIIEIARRQAEKQRSAYLSTPTHLLSQRASKVTSVPKTLRDAYSKPTAGYKQEQIKEAGLKRKIDATSDGSTEEGSACRKSKLQQEKEEKAKRREIALAHGRELRERDQARRFTTL
ncbi:hypothetical protein GP486_005122 [Trichoglossum hirsutum]|uniref:Elongin-A n=1 Tax=Trichoglossum hirsutum TaxID=265104 RepID=A0A9P8LA01_9PEZI|nr:hypothetical protein GP486_005122 [Trichoglossum hirsutum]